MGKNSGREEKMSVAKSNKSRSLLKNQSKSALKAGRTSTNSKAAVGGAGSKKVKIEQPKWKS